MDYCKFLTEIETQKTCNGPLISENLTTLLLVLNLTENIPFSLKSKRLLGQLQFPSLITTDSSDFRYGKLMQVLRCVLHIYVCS